MAQLEQEHENLRAAIFWLFEQARGGKEQSKHQAELAMRLCTALSWFWSIRGYIREGQDFLDQALAFRESVSAPVRARASHAAAELAFLLDDVVRTESLSRESLQLLRELGNKAGMADALWLLATSSWAMGEYTLALPQLEEAVSLYQEMGDNWKHGRGLSQLARIKTVQGEYEQAQELLDQSLALYRALGDKERIGWVLYLQARLLFLSGHDIVTASRLTEQSLTVLQEINTPWFRAYSLVLLGQIALQQGDKVQARDLFEESRSAFKDAGDQAGMAEALMGLASVAMMQNDFAQAHDLYQESFLILQRIHYKEVIPSCLEGLAAVVAEQGELAWASHLWGAAEALREAIGTPIPSVYRLSHEQAVAKVRAQMSNETFIKAWNEGHATTPEKAITRES
jgi:tetratricopeptide (TPR) repeat protein